jgi:DnaJ-class molecular chaperone
MNRKRDAPGWSDDTDSLGPVCWKCKGTGEKVGKKKHTSTVVCPVCFGAKRVQKKQLKQSRVPTTITTKPKPTNTIGPDFADVPVDLNVEIEEVCHLLGKWRIVQSLRGGHRW